MSRRSFISALAVFVALGCYAQNRVSADVEIKTLSEGKVTTVTKRVFCNGNGRLVTVFKSPSECWLVSNLKGEIKMYSPARNEVFYDQKEDFSTKDDLLYLFLTGRSADLGLAGFGYKLQSSEYEEGGYLKRTFTTTRHGSAPKVELVLKDYLPIYVAYLDGGGTVLSKTYLSGYDYESDFVFPSRVTNIEYRKNRDSTVTRTRYLGLDTSGNDPGFTFEVPAGAIPVKNPLRR